MVYFLNTHTCKYYIQVNITYNRITFLFRSSTCWFYIYLILTSNFPKMQLSFTELLLRSTVQTLSICDYSMMYYHPQPLDKDTEKCWATCPRCHSLEAMKSESNILGLWPYGNTLSTIFWSPPSTRANYTTPTFHSPSFRQSSNTVVFISVKKKKGLVTYSNN